MSSDLLDFAIGYTTIGWFAWLLAWPVFALANVVGWGIAAIRASGRGSHRLARWSAAIGVAVLLDGYLGLTDQAVAVLAGVPSRWRLLAQLGMLVVPFAASIAGLLTLGVWPWRSDRRRPAKAPTRELPKG